MNVLIVNYEYPPIGGGAAKATYNIVKRLVLKNDIKLFLLFGANKEFSDYPIIEDVDFHPVFYPRKSIHETGALGMIVFLFKASIELKKIIKNNKIDLIHYFFSVPTGLLSFLHMKSIPYIVSLRGGDVPNYNPGEMQLFHSLLKPLNKLVVKNANKIIPNSNALGESAKKELKINHYYTIYNGIEINKNISKEKIPSSSLKLITVSRLIRWKKIDLVIKALAEIKNVNYIIIGKGKEENSLRRLVSKLDLYDRIIFLGSIPNQNINKYLLESDVFILPSLNEGLSIGVLEAMAIGLPIIGANTGGMKETIINNYNGILMEPNNLEELKKAILFFLNNISLINEYGQNSRNLIEKKFILEKVVDKYYKIYFSVINNGYL